MAEIHQHYNLPLVSYSYTDDMLLLQISTYVKHYQQQTLDCFVYEQLQYHIIQTENLQMEIMPISD